MKKILKSSLITALILGTTSVGATEVDNVKDMFAKGEVSGQVRVAYNTATEKTTGTPSEKVSATAIGGQLKFETASLYGVSVGAAAYTAQAIMGLSGKPSDGKFDDGFTSSEKHYTEIAEAYVNFAYEGFNIRGGRQLIDTPLADSDDIGMTPHTFEAVVASYELKDLGLTIIAANVQRMQGADADYENVTLNSWMDTGDGGTNMGAVLFANDMVEAGAWYYDVGKAASAIYADAVVSMEFSPVELNVGVQYLSESEKSNSTIDGSIAGAMAEVAVADFGMMLAYNSTSVKAGKEIFEGFGGGSSYTNMDTTTAGGFDDSVVVGMNYEIAGVNIFGAYGSFDPKIGKKTTEIDVGVEYDYNDGEADIGLIYVSIDDKEATTKTSYVTLVANYNF